MLLFDALRLRKLTLVSFVLTKMRTCDVLVGAIPAKEGDSLAMRMTLCASLWAKGIRAEFVQKANPKLVAQFQVCEKERIPIFVYLGPDEVAKDEVKIRIYTYLPDGTSTHQEQVVARVEFVEVVETALKSV